MTHKLTLILSLGGALLLSACSETEAERRDRLNDLTDELIASTDEAAFADRYSELSSEDREAFSEILQDRISAVKSNLTDGSALTQKMIGYAAIDSGKADRLVAQCEAELGISSLGEDATKIAECVDQRW